MKTTQKALDDKIRLMLDMAIKRYCFRVGRHGETYLLEKGIKEGLIEYLVPKIRELIDETVD